MLKYESNQDLNEFFHLFYLFVFCRRQINTIYVALSVCVYRSIFCLSYLEYFSWSPGRWCWYCVCVNAEKRSTPRWSEWEETRNCFCFLRARLHLGSAMHIRTLMDSLQYAENDFDCRNIWLTPVWNSWLILSWLLHYCYRTFYFIVATTKQHQYHKGTLEHKKKRCILPMWRMRFDRYPAMRQFAIHISSDSIGLSERSMSFKVLSTDALCALKRTPMNQIEDIWARIIIVEIATAWCNGPSSISCLFSISLVLLSSTGGLRNCVPYANIANAISHHLLGFIANCRCKPNKRFQVGELMRNFHAESYQSLTHSLVASNECVHVCLCERREYILFAGKYNEEVFGWC